MVNRVSSLMLVGLALLSVPACLPAPAQQAAQISLQPALVCSPNSLSFTARAGQVTPMEQVINISNQGGGMLAWTISDNVRWIEVKQATSSDMLQAGAVRAVVDPAGMAAGDYTGIITITSEGALGSPCHVPVFLNVASLAIGPAVIQMPQQDSPPGDTAVIWKNDNVFIQYADTNCCMVSGSITNTDKWWYLSKVTITGSRGMALIAETLPPGETIIYSRCIPCYQREDVKLTYMWFKP